MPGKNVVKSYVEGGIYHIYNRGNNNRPIFFKDVDFEVFVWYLDRYLSKVNPYNPYLYKPKDYYGRVSLLAFCLIRNHIHLLLQQKELKDMGKFMQSLITAYTMYVNRKYERTGCLFEGVYKGRLIEDDNDLINMSRYIHQNAGDTPNEILTYPFSSIKNYTGKGIKWGFVNENPVLNIFNNDIELYEKFVLEVSPH